MGGGLRGEARNAPGVRLLRSPGAATAGMAGFAPPVAAAVERGRHPYYSVRRYGLRSAPPDTCGNAGRNALHAPGHVHYGAAVMKNIRLRERMRLRFRADAFHPLQHFGVRLPRGEYRIDDAGAHQLNA